MTANGKEAVDRVARDGRAAYSLVLLDVCMPVMDGYQATREILALEPELPVIGQTAFAMAEERAACLASGMVAHIAKPIEIEELVRVVQEHAR
jgi:CheY-like chemotaxis protein